MFQSIYWQCIPSPLLHSVSLSARLPMSTYEIDDFRRIQEETSRASARLTEMRREIKERLDHMAPPSTLAALAQDLSPSRFSASPVVHFPIHTPMPSLFQNQKRSDSFSGSEISEPETQLNAVASHMDKQLNRVLSEFEERINERILILKSENQKQRELKESIEQLISDSEKEIVGKINLSVKSLLANYRETPDQMREIVLEEGLAILQRKEEIQLNQLEQTKKMLISNKMETISASIKNEFNTELGEIRKVLQTIPYQPDHLSYAKKEISSQIQTSVLNLAKDLDDNLDHHGSRISRSPTPFLQRTVGEGSGPTSLVEENVKLRSLVRKMKLALSKWRIDYLSNMADRPGVGFAGVVVGDAFDTLSDNLMRMWTAVTPSGQELIQFLVNIEAAVHSKGKIPIMSAYDYECKKNLDKLPIAQLAAQREFLLSTQGHVTDEIRQIETELIEKISQFEHKYGQKFIFRSDDDQEYTQVIRNSHHVVMDVTNN